MVSLGSQMALEDGARLGRGGGGGEEGEDAIPS